MKNKWFFCFAILSTLFFFNHSSNAATVELILPDGTTWTGELGQSVHVEYHHKNETANPFGRAILL
jgi:hypothetical protein